MTYSVARTLVKAMEEPVMSGVQRLPMTSALSYPNTGNLEFFSPFSFILFVSVLLPK